MNALVGRKFLFDGAAIELGFMPIEFVDERIYPAVRIISVSSYKVSRQAGKDSTILALDFDRAIQAFSINLLGVSPDTGTVIEGLYKDIENLSLVSLADAAQLTVFDLMATAPGVELVVDIFSTVLNQEGANRINIYGQALDGTWTPYSPEGG